jgi:hypothetical protein
MGRLSATAMPEHYSPQPGLSEIRPALDAIAIFAADSDKLTYSTSVLDYTMPLPGC